MNSLHAPLNIWAGLSSSHGDGCPSSRKCNDSQGNIARSPAHSGSSSSPSSPSSAEFIPATKRSLSKRQQSSLSLFVKDRRKDNEIRAILQTVEDYSSPPECDDENNCGFGVVTCSDDGHYSKAAIKEFSIRHFPNGDLFSGNIDARTGELIYGRMTCSLAMEVYEGPFSNGKRHGDGAVCTKMNGAGKFLGRYHEGEMHSGTLVVCRGTPDDFTYTGTFQDNDFHGEGAIATSNGTVYRGQFAYGTFHGTGTLHDASDDSVYTGDFVDGIFHGFGTMTYANGSTYVGTWLQGSKVEGKETLQNGDIFEGKFRDDFREGYGILQTKNRVTKKGIWSNDDIVEGVDLKITFADGHIYVGNHMHSRPHGFGEMDYTDYGSGKVTYVGTFVNGFRHGEGRCIFQKTGEEYEGEWVCDEPIELKIFQHNGPLIDSDEEVPDEAIDCPSSLDNSASDFDSFVADFSMSKTAESVVSHVSFCTTETEESTISSLEPRTKSQRKQKCNRCRRTKDFDSNLEFSLSSLNIFDFGLDTPKLYRYENGDTFKGRLDKSRLRQGSGVYTEHRTGSIFDGGWKDNMRHGVGLLTLPSGVEYSGEFFRDSIHGQGSITLIDSSVYTGGFLNGLFHGHGTFEDIANRRTYIGEFKKGLRHGEGEEKYADGSCYKGDHKDNKRHGIGVLYDPDGNKIYFGDWCEDVRHGQGTLYRMERRDSLWEGKYQGSFYQGKCSGQGEFSYPDGTTIEGQWLEDVPRDGDWKITYPDQSKYYGFATFRASEELIKCDESSPCSASTFSHQSLRVPIPHGFGALTCPNGQRYAGTFVYGEYQDSPGGI